MINIQMNVKNYLPCFKDVKIKINSLKSTLEIIRNTSLPICKEIITSMINQQLHVRAAYLLNTKRIFLISLFLFRRQKGL